MLKLKSITSDRSVDSALPREEQFLPQRHKSAFTFITHQGFATQILAYMLDSLVRVSRRVNENHFVKIAKNTNSEPYPVPRFAGRTALLSKPTNKAEAGANSATRTGALPFPQSTPPYQANGL